MELLITWISQKEKHLRGGCTDAQQGDLISLLFHQNKGGRLKVIRSAREGCVSTGPHAGSSMEMTHDMKQTVGQPQKERRYRHSSR
jgi:hypothetical protein